MTAGTDSDLLGISRPGQLLLTPIKYTDLIYFSKDALLTAFTTGNLFIILPMLSERSKEIYNHLPLDHEDRDSYIDTVIPVSFNFPNAGKLLLLMFILFAGWFSGLFFSISNYLQFILSGALTFFGSVDAAIPFLLNLFGIPADLYQLYLATSVFNARFASLLGAMHFFTFTILLTSMLLGKAKFDWRKFLK